MMSKTETRDRAQYDRVREAFTKLDMQDKAAFVLEATFSTFGEAFADAGKQFADVVEKVTADDFFSGCGKKTASEETEEKPTNGRKTAGEGDSPRKEKDEDAD